MDTVAAFLNEEIKDDVFVEELFNSAKMIDSTPLLLSI
jgi:hypothetical protein